MLLIAWDDIRVRWKHSFNQQLNLLHDQETTTISHIADERDRAKSPPSSAGGAEDEAAQTAMAIWS